MNESLLPNRLQALKTVPDSTLGDCIQNYYKKALENCTIKELEDEMKLRVEARKLRYKGETIHWEGEGQWEPNTQAGLKELDKSNSAKAEMDCSKTEVQISSQVQAQPAPVPQVNPQQQKGKK